MSKAIAASIVPLFDRLSGVAHASQDGRLLDAGGLQHSLQLDLARLFNVRNALTIQEYLTCEPSVLHYGLPDSLSLSPQSQLDLEIWAKVLERCIEMYEPRLSHVQVNVKPDPKKHYGARATIAAAVMLGKQLCRVNFDVVLNTQSAQVEAAA
ncbi:type VI secretion system baseplate subunit TssE [Noviherbaspirillum sp. Root189]|uniref:type VI secretion system baseplate subunit TssE n=1 Tax=Noviherbaspirillum sp. Root189 TaxID=1736487 RepID=UPI000710113F|nr:type VI secretion system baseplate subunit TssE [Noviherbaspirillum sp. Root189]KRB67886.1 type VI secretion protein, lysozyme-like protein [Noviherbaspirillum sp. Root189]